MLELLVGGLVYSGWKEISINRSVEVATSSFIITMFEQANWKIDRNDTVIVMLDGFSVLTGYIDKISRSLDGGSHSYKVKGRGLTSDLVDCSAMNEPGEFVGLDLNAIVKQLAAPIGVAVVVSDNPGVAFPKFSIQPGESAWEAIERACRMRQHLAFSNRQDDLVLARPGNEIADVDLVEGRNILSVDSTTDNSKRYSRYVVRGQSGGNDSWSGENAAEAEGVATDPSVKRKRELLIVAEASITPQIATQRAQWEAITRASRSTKVKIKVQGWREKGDKGSMWFPNKQVFVNARSVGVYGYMVIIAVKQTQGSGGTITNLELMREDAFLPQPAVPADDTVEVNNA